MCGEVWLKVYIETLKEKAFIAGPYSDAFLDLKIGIQ